MNGEPALRLKRAALRPRDAWLAAAVGAVSLALYVRTLAPGLLPGDSGEFQVLSTLLGNTHPTGYPIYILLGKVFTWLPVRDVAYRVNLLSAVMGALTVAGVYLAGRMLCGHSGPALVGALALAVSPTFWSQAVIAEVYTPGAAFLVGVLVCLLLWEVYGHPAALFAAGLLGGLSLGVHMTVALVAPAVGVFLLVSRPSPQPASGRPPLTPPSPPPWGGERGGERGGGEGRWAVWRPALLGALVGIVLMVCVFLALDWHNPVASYFNTSFLPAYSAWGFRASDVNSPFERLAFDLSGQQFHSLMFTDPRQVMPRLAAEYWHRLPGELSWWIVGLAGLGLVSLIVRRWRVALLFFLALAVHWGYTFNYDLWDLYVFFIPGYCMLATLASAGLGWLLDGLGRLIPQRVGRLMAEAVLAVAVLAVGVWPVCAPRLEMVRAGSPDFPADDRFNGYPADDYGMNGVHQEATTFVRWLDPGAIVFTDWYWAYPFYYAAHVEQGRTDLVFLETIPQMENNRLPDSFIPYIRDRLPEHPIYFSERRPELVKAGFILIPTHIGSRLLYRVQ